MEDGAGNEALAADCERCAALCCVGLAFAASAHFAIDKPAGRPCPNLAGYACGRHDDLRRDGFAGCIAFECYGAGQHVVQVSFKGRTWKDDPSIAGSMFATFNAVRQLNELRFHLAAARRLAGGGELGAALDEAAGRLARLVGEPPETLERLDPSRVAGEVSELLGRASRAARGKAGLAGPDLRGAELLGRNLAGADLRGADLAGALLIGADLRAAALARADLLGADLRAAALHGADLERAMFVTQAQLELANGDHATRLPPGLARPRHWQGSGPSR